MPWAVSVRLPLCFALGLAACDDLSIRWQAVAAAPAPDAASLTSLNIDPSSAHAEPGGATFDGRVWRLSLSGRALRYPVPVQMGDYVTEWILTLRRDDARSLSWGQLEIMDPVDQESIALGAAAIHDSDVTGYVSLHVQLDPPHFVTDDESLSLFVTGYDGNGATVADRAGPAIVYVMRP